MFCVYSTCSTLSQTIEFSSYRALEVNFSILLFHKYYVTLLEGAGG